ncbi:MAG: PA14 domain-containing protein [Phycisphaerae bacterium]
MIKTTTLLLAFAFASLLIGCDKGNPQPASEPDDNRKAQKQTDPADRRTDAAPDTPEEPDEVVVTTTQPQPEPDEPAVDPNEFPRRLSEVLAVEENAEFSKAMRMCFRMQQEFGNDPRVKQLQEVLSRLREAREAGAPVPLAIAKLTADDPTTRLVAARQIRDAGHAGEVFLRKTLRENDGPLAVEAARWLAQWQNDRALPIFADKLRGDPSKELVAVIVKGLADWRKPLPAEVLQPLLNRIRNDADYSELSSAEVLAKEAEDVGGTAEAFNKRIEKDGAFLTLQTYAERAADSDNDDARLWALKHAAVFGLYQPGLLGMYYHGDNFDNLVMTRVDKAVDFQDGDGSQFRYPQGRKEEISIRWFAKLRIPEDAEYVLSGSSDDGKRIYVDGKLVVDDWRDQGMTEKTAKIKLTKGMHDLKVEYYQGSGGAGMVLKWAGPGFEKKLLTAPAVLAPPKEAVAAESKDEK